MAEYRTTKLFHPSSNQKLSIPISKRLTPVRSILRLNKFQYQMEQESVFLMFIDSDGSRVTRNEPMRAQINSPIDVESFFHQLALIIRTKIFNYAVMHHQSVPTIWKTANARSIRKESPIIECTQTNLSNQYCNETF